MVFKNFYLNNGIVGSNFSSIPQSRFFVVYNERELVLSSLKLLQDVMNISFDKDTTEYYMGLISIDKIVNID